MSGASTSAERGRHLEERIASYFASHGYETRTNAILEGRTGGRHEIDVLAEKSDPLTTIRIAVECKAWQHPIEKDVVSKLSYLLGDLGLNKGIIVSLNGCHSGAEIAARELGIDLWGPEELDRRLGKAGLSDLLTGPAPRLAHGHPFVTSVDAAQALVRKQAKGRFGLRVLDNVVWLSPAWVPTYVVEIGVSRAAVRRRRQHLTSSTIANVYDAISGRYLGPASAEPTIEIDLGDIGLRPAIRDTKIVADMHKAVDRYRSVSQPTAKQRHAEHLGDLGIPTPCDAVEIGASNLVYAPTYLGILHRAGTERVVAVSGSRGEISSRLSSVLTANLSRLKAGLGEMAERGS